VAREIEGSLHPLKMNVRQRIVSLHRTNLLFTLPTYNFHGTIKAIGLGLEILFIGIPIRKLDDYTIKTGVLTF
jgi:hypothetical protein